MRFLHLVPTRLGTCSLVFAALLTACGQQQQRPAPQASAAAVPIIRAHVGTVHPRAALSGVIAPFQNVGITSTLIEPVDAVYVREGDTVQRGELLAQLDTADLRAQLAQFRATVSSNQAIAAHTYDLAGLTIVQNNNTVSQARAAVLQAQQTLATDTVNLNRYADLLKNGYVPQQQYDAQATLVKNDQQSVRAMQVTLQNDLQQVSANGTTSTGLQGSQVVAARATTAISQAQANQINVAIAKARIVSPIDGVVVNRFLNPGEFPGTRQIFTLQQVDRVYAVLNGSAAQIRGLRAGATATVTASSLPGRNYTGTVAGILNAVNPGSTNFIVKVALSNVDGNLRPGIPVLGTAHLPAASGVQIPETAFLDTTNSTIQVVNSAGLVATSKVTMLADDGTNAIVTGIPLGAAVVVNGASGLTDGQIVSPQAVAER